VSVYEITTEVTGFTGGPGILRFYTSEPPVNTGPVTAFFNAVKGGLARGTSWQVHNTGNVYAEQTAELTGSWTVGGDGPPIAAVPSETYPAGVGVKLVLLTSTIVAGRRVRGGPFLVPCSGSIYDNDGSINASSLTIFRDALEDLFAAEDSLVVWSRPFVPRLGQTRPARVGSLAPVTSTTVADKVSWLRSRR